MSSSASPPTRVRRIPYRRPWFAYIPTIILFGTFNYIILASTVNEAGTALVLPAYAVALQEERPDAFLTRAVLFFERYMAGAFFYYQGGLVGGMRGMQVIWVLAWLIHIGEFIVAIRICLACHASAWTTLRYGFCTLTAGFSQLIPLRQARDEYVSKKSE